MKFLLICLLLLSISCETREKQPIAHSGKLNLSEWNFEEKGLLNLDGEWNFNWKSFSEKDSIYTNTRPIIVPKNWAQISGLQSDGYGTYHLKIKGLEANKLYAFKIIYINTAFKFYVNDKLIAENGTIGTSKDSSKPHQIPGVYSYYSDRSTLDIRIQVSNFHFRKSGIIRPIEFGLEKDIQTSWSSAIASDLFMAGSLFMFAIYHMALFFLRREDKSNFWFGFFCFVVATRTVLIDERFLLTVYPNFDWFITLKIIYCGIYLTLPTMISFIYSQYPKHTTKKFVSFTHYASAFCILVTLFTEPNIYVNFFQYFLFLVLLFGIYIIYVIYNAARVKEEGALFSLISFVTFYITVVLAILYEVDYPALPSLLPFSLLLFLFSQSYIISFRFSKAFKEVAQLNKNLEKRVEERTESYKKAKQVADSANEAKSRYLSFITHELRTPITAVNGYTELLLEDLEEDENTSYIEDVKKIKTASVHLVSLVNNILDIAKIEAGKMDVFVDKFDIKSLIIEVHTTLAPVFSKNQNKFTIHIAPEIDSMMNDRMKIKQILINILSNATKFTTNGVVDLNIMSEPSFIVFKVTDTGVGMSDEQLNSLFESYTQFKQDRNVQGTGLGMAICKQFTELMNGVISVESKVEKGTTFTLKIPKQYEAL